MNNRCGSQAEQAVLTMHELSVMNSMINSVLAETEKYGAIEIKKVTLEVGEFSFLAPDQLKFAFDICKKDRKWPHMNNAELVLLKKRGEIRCDCGYSGVVPRSNTEVFHQMYPLLSCPRCGGTPRDITGKECIIKNIKMEVP